MFKKSLQWKSWRDWLILLHGCVFWVQFPPSLWIKLTLQSHCRSIIVFFLRLCRNRLDIVWNHLFQRIWQLNNLCFNCQPQGHNNAKNTRLNISKCANMSKKQTFTYSEPKEIDYSRRRVLRPGCIVRAFIRLSARGITTFYAKLNSCLLNFLNMYIVNSVWADSCQ